MAEAERCPHLNRSSQAFRMNVELPATETRHVVAFAALGAEQLLDSPDRGRGILLAAARDPFGAALEEKTVAAGSPPPAVAGNLLFTTKWSSAKGLHVPVQENLRTMR